MIGLRFKFTAEELRRHFVERISHYTQESGRIHEAMVSLRETIKVEGRHCCAADNLPLRQREFENLGKVIDGLHVLHDHLFDRVHELTAQELKYIEFLSPLEKRERALLTEVTSSDA